MSLGHQQYYQPNDDFSDRSDNQQYVPMNKRGSGPPDNIIYSNGQPDDYMPPPSSGFLQNPNGPPQYGGPPRYPPTRGRGRGPPRGPPRGPYSRGPPRGPRGPPRGPTEPPRGPTEPPRGPTEPPRGPTE
eukprot:27706_1